MPQPIIDFLLHPWTIAVGSILVGAFILWAWSGLRRGLVALAKRVWHAISRKREPRATPAQPSSAPNLPEFVKAPRWELRHREDDRHMYGVKNVGGLALHVRVRPEDDDVVAEGDLDVERVEPGHYVPFRITRLVMDGVLDTWIRVDCRDSAGAVQQPSRVKIPGMIM